MATDSQASPPSPAGTAARLLAAAATRFRAKGYAATSTRELAGLLGIQNASLYHHIAKKEDLLYELCVDGLRHIRSAVEQALAATPEPGERVRAAIKAHVAAALEDRDKHATMLIELRSLSGERRAEVLLLRDAYEGLLRHVILDAQVHGALRRDIPAKYLALALLNLLNWSIFWFRPEGELSPVELGDLLATLFLEGVAERREA